MIERCIVCDEITEVDTRDNVRTTYTTCPKCKPERANVPTKFTLVQLKEAYRLLELGLTSSAEIQLELAKQKSVDIRERTDIQEILELLAEIPKAMKLLRNSNLY